MTNRDSHNQSSSTQSPHILIVGGGLGGLCLAQGLKRAGVAFTVFERDHSPTSRLQGYRLSMTPSGLGALQANLPAELWQRIVQACTSQIKGIAFVSETLEPKFFKANPPEVDVANRYVSISRTTLREVLLTGIGDQVQYGKRLLRYEQAGNGRVRCVFEGGAAEGDLLVGCDGASSIVRSQRLLRSNKVDTYADSIAGKVLFDDHAIRDFYAPPLAGNAVVLDSTPQGMFLAPHEIDEGEHRQAYVFWSFVAKEERFDRDLKKLTAAELIATVDRLTSGWHPRLKSLIASAQPNSVLSLRFQSSELPQLGETQNITLLGDAVHNMPPTGGEGANMALRDAAVFSAALAKQKHERTSLIAAVASYEQAMLAYAFPAVELSMHNLYRMVHRKPQA